MKTSDYEKIYSTIITMGNFLVNECKTFCELIESFDDFDSVIKRIHLIEDDADQVFHDFRYFVSNGKLAEDKNALYLINIVNAIEAVIDDVDELVTDLYRYDVHAFKDNSISSVISLERASSYLLEIILMVKKSDNVNATFKSVLELDHYKVEASKLHDINMNKLFATEKDPIEVLKWERVYTSILTVYEDFENVSEEFGKFLFGWA